MRVELGVVGYQWKRELLHCQPRCTRSIKELVMELVQSIACMHQDHWHVKQRSLAVRAIWCHSSPHTECECLPE
jgi:hypothetical protein